MVIRFCPRHVKKSKIVRLYENQSCHYLLVAVAILCKMSDQDKGKTRRPKQPRQTRKQRKESATGAPRVTETAAHSPIDYEHSATRYIINGVLIIVMFGYGVRRFTSESNFLVNPDKLDKIDFCNFPCSTWMDSVPLYNIYRERFAAPMMTCSCGDCTTIVQPMHIVCTNKGKDLTGDGPFWDCQTDPVWEPYTDYQDRNGYPPPLELKAATISCKGDQATGNCVAGTFHLEYEWDQIFTLEERQAAFKATHDLQMMLRVQHWQEHTLHSTPETHANTIAKPTSLVQTNVGSNDDTDTTDLDKLADGIVFEQDGIVNLAPWVYVSAEIKSSSIHIQPWSHVAQVQRDNNHYIGVHDIYFHTTGSDERGDGTMEHPWKTIAHAIETIQESSSPPSETNQYVIHPFFH